MSSPLTYIIFGAANFFGPQIAPDNSPTASGMNPNIMEIPLMHLVSRYNYTYTPSVGTHKVHSELENWNEARRSCLDEGGHLAVINSGAEAQAIAQLLKNSNLEWAHIGFHDLYQEGDYVTIHGESLAKAGYERWHAGEPNNWDNKEHCGVLWSDGSLNDGRCEHRHNFICELPHVHPCVIQHMQPATAFKKSVDITSAVKVQPVTGLQKSIDTTSAVKIIRYESTERNRSDDLNHNQQFS